MIHGGPSIVKNGLVWMIDPSNTDSYRSGSLILYNLMGQDGHGDVINLPITTSNSTCFSGSGVGYANFYSQSMFSFSSSNFTFAAWWYYDGTAKHRAIMGHRNDSPFNQWSLSQTDNSMLGGDGHKAGFFTCPEGGGVGFYSHGNYSLTSSGIGWYYSVVTMEPTIQRFYVNGVNVITNTVNVTGKTYLIPDRPLYYGAVYQTGLPVTIWNSFFSVAQIYNRPLTAEEVLQNYNALKGRFDRT